MCAWLAARAIQRRRDAWNVPLLRASLGLAAGGAQLGLAAGRAALLPARVAVRAPFMGASLRGAARDLAHQGSLVRERARVRAETATDELLASSEVERAADRLLAGPLTDAVGCSLAAHRVVERVAVQLLAIRRPRSVDRRGAGS